MIRKISLITMFVVMAPITVVAQDPRVAAATARVHGNIIETVFSGLSVCDKAGSIASLKELQKKYELLGWQTATIKNIFSLIISQIEQADQNDRGSFTRARDMLTMFFDASEHRGIDFLRDVEKHIVAIKGDVASASANVDRALESIQTFRSQFPVSEYDLQRDLQQRIADFEALLVQLRANPENISQYFEDCTSWRATFSLLRDAWRTRNGNAPERNANHFATHLAWLLRNMRTRIESKRALEAKDRLVPDIAMNNEQREQFLACIQVLKQAPHCMDMAPGVDIGMRDLAAGVRRYFAHAINDTFNPVGYAAQAVFPVADKATAALGAQTGSLVAQGPNVYVRPTTSRAAQLIAREQPMLSLVNVLWVRKYARLIHWFVEPSFRRNGILARLIKWTASRIDARTEESVLRMEKAIKLGVPVGKLLMGLNEFIAARRGVSNWVDGASDYIRQRGVDVDNDFARTLNDPQGIASRAVNGVDAVRTWSCMNRMTVGERKNTLAALKPTELLQRPQQQ